MRILRSFELGFEDKTYVFLASVGSNFRWNLGRTHKSNDDEFYDKN